MFCVLEVSFVAGVGFGDFGGSRRTSAKFVPHSPSYRTERWKEILLEMEKDHKSSISWADHEPIEDHILSWLHVEVEATILERFDSHPALVCLRVQAAKSQGRTHQIRVHMAHEAFVYSKLPAMSTEHGKSRNCNTSLVEICMLCICIFIYIYMCIYVYIHINLFFLVHAISWQSIWEIWWQTPVSNFDRGIPWWEIRYMVASHHPGVRGQAA